MKTLNTLDDGVTSDVVGLDAYEDATKTSFNPTENQDAEIEDAESSIYPLKHFIAEFGEDLIVNRSKVGLIAKQSWSNLHYLHNLQKISLIFHI